ncbi:MAG: type 2 isopentenyl-diphosphate Delta-isomerase [Bacteroidetes bacterium]|nr:type 2 isopentenyl-diphosphate Delta-isomerase [Bacteroidota bacterium]
MDKLEPTTAARQDDPTAAARKRDHIEMAFRSQVERGEVDGRFYYEPLLAAHPQPGSLPPFSFLGKTLRAPLWVSSMTGGTEWAHTINHNLARACREFGMGMGLGSCRSLLFSDDNLEDFAVRRLIGDNLPLYANLGVAQLEQLIDSQALWRVTALHDKLQADGLIIHVNPLQEWLQPEGDRFKKPPLDTISTILEEMPELKIIVKEVGQGMGYESLRALFQLPVQAVDFAASGGTNFAKLELLRSDETSQETFQQLAQVGHTAEEMVHFTNQIEEELGEKMRCRQVIISGGIGSFLDGFYLMNKLHLPCVYGQASGFLKHAQGGYEELRKYVEAQVRGLELAGAFLKVKQ